MLALVEVDLGGWTSPRIVDESTLRSSYINRRNRYACDRELSAWSTGQTFADAVPALALGALT